MNPAASMYRPRLGRRRAVGIVFGIACFLATLTGIVVLTVVLASIVSLAKSRWNEDGEPLAPVATTALPSFAADLTTKYQSSDPAEAGYKAGLVGSICLLVLVVLFAIPIGVGAAVFLEEFTQPSRLRSLIQLNLANLAGVPSIVYGILGLALFVRAFGYERFALGETLWAGGLTLSLLVLPIVVIATREALRAVPSSLRQGALALGATRWQMVRDHVLPSAVPGILTGTILAVSRAIGETAPLLMVGAAGAIYQLPTGPSSRYTALPVEIYNYAKESDRSLNGPIAAGGILILLALLLTMNSVAIVIRNRYRTPSR
jgi:phosphate transport system permease protein